MEKLKLKYKDPLEAKKRNISTGQEYVRLIKVQKGKNFTSEGR